MLTVTPEYVPLLRNLSDVPSDYIRQVSHVKRAVERWVMDPDFREAYLADAVRALADIGAEVTPEDVAPIIEEEPARRMNKALREGRVDGFPAAARRYRKFIWEKIADRTEHRNEAGSHHPVMETWRKRQVHRCVGELGPAKAESIVHAPAAFELARGCSVGCWFCGVDAPRLEQTWDWTHETSAFWRGCLAAFRDVIGSCAAFSFCYWATDPLDNPDYGRFIRDFHATLGRCPQTTTAMPTRDLERTRRVLRMAAELESRIDRFSVLTVKMMRQVHDFFTPEELLRVELIPQNKESNATRHLKAVAGRARAFKAKRGAELVPLEEGSTIACVSGFLFNMIDRSVKIVSPCSSSDRFPLGYWILDEETFDSPQDLRDRLERMIFRSMRTTLRVTDVVRPRRDLAVEMEDGRLSFRSTFLKVRFRDFPHLGAVARLLGLGLTAGDLALAIEKEHEVPLDATMRLLLGFFDKGLLDEEPEPRPAPTHRPAGE